MWAGSHLAGVGEIVDVLLLITGTFMIGWSMKDVAEDVYTFAMRTINGRTDADLDAAADAFSHAVVLAGITTIMALLLRRSVKEIQVTRGPGLLNAMRPRNPGLPAVGSDPAAGRMWSRPGIVSDPALPAGEGSTSPFGEVRISSNGTLSEQALVRIHEQVHQFLTPRLGLLRTFRVQLGIAGYTRTALLRYIEEAMAESVAQLRVNGGAAALLEGGRFPVANGYMTITDLMSEGAAIGTVTAGTQQFSVQFVPGGKRDGFNASYPLALPPR